MSPSRRKNGGELSLPEYEQRLPQLDPIAVVQRRWFQHGLPIDPSAALRIVVVQHVTVARRLDLGVPASHGGIAEEANLRPLIETQRGAAIGEQVSPPFLPTTEDLDPRPAEDLF